MHYEHHPEPSGSEPYADHSRRSHIFRIVRAWYFFPLHAILVIVFAIIALCSINGKTFPTSSDSPAGATISHVFQGKLRQTDVTTLVSAALVVIRLTLNVCSSIAAQRSIFILLEKCGITLHEVERIFSYEQGPLGTSGFKIGAIVLLLLLIPAQLSAPLAQGAISWEPHLTLQPTDYNVSLNVAGPGAAFAEFQAHAEPRDFSVRRASGLAVIHRFGPDFYSVMDKEGKVPSRRWAPAFREHELSNDTKGYQALPGNTTIGNTTLPYFRMSNLTWIDYDESLERFLWNENGLFNVTGPMNPIRTSLPGNAVILREAPLASWNSNWPNPTLLNMTYTIAVLASRLTAEEQAAAPEMGCPRTNSVFGNLPAATQHSIVAGPTNFTNCYLFATAHVVAGTTQCLDCSIISPGVVARPGNASFSFTLSPDPLLPIIMGMLPETMISIATANATYAPTWNNLPGFVAGAFSAAYQASWNDLTDRLALSPSPHDDPNDDPDYGNNMAMQTTTTNLSTPAYPLRADVDQQRVRTWLALHIVGVIGAGVLLALLQARCVGLPVIDFVAACLLADSSSVVRSADAAGVRNAPLVTHRGSAAVGQVVLREEGGCRVLKRKKDAGKDEGGLWGGGVRNRCAAAKKESWGGLSLLSRSTTFGGYGKVPEEQGGSGGGYGPGLTPQTGSSWQSSETYGSPGFARDGGGGELRGP